MDEDTRRWPPRRYNPAQFNPAAVHFDDPAKTPLLAPLVREGVPDVRRDRRRITDA